MNSKNRWQGLDDWQVVCAFLPAGWQQAARSCGALRRAREVRDAQLLLRLLLIHLADGCSLHETAVRAKQAGWCDLSAVAVFKRLVAAEEWLRWLAERLWRQSTRPATPSGYRIRAVDATTVQEAGSTGTDWRVHYVIDLANLQCDHFELTDAKGGETFRRIPIQPRDLILGDRAYGTPPGVSHVMAAGGNVLVRINLSNLPLHTASGRRIPILSRLRTLRIGQVGEWPAFVRTGKTLVPGRLIAVKRGQRAAARARRRIEREARRKQKEARPQTLTAAGYVFVWTSLDARAMSATEVLELYRLRWQIELAFKRMKSILGLGQLPKSTDASARAWVHGKLLVALLIERLQDEADAVSPWGYRLVAPAQPMARNKVPVP
jgi:hypothetical protein